jgi:hypothetical protein
MADMRVEQVDDALPGRLERGCVGIHGGQPGERLMRRRDVVPGGTPIL